MTRRVRWPQLGCILALAGIAGALGCGDDDGPAPEDEVLLPADYADSYTEVRDCRASGDHDLNHVRVLADDAALDAYQNRDEPFPEGAVVVKEEYEFDDDTCEGPIKQWTLMQRLQDSGDTLGWRWQQIDAQRHVVSEDSSRCIGCHSGCGVPPDGYQGTCAMP